MWSCFCNLLELSPASVPESSRMAATLPLRFGGLGLSSAGRLRHAAHWASWADCIGMMHQRHPAVAWTIIEAIESTNPTDTAQGVVSSMESLRAVGFTIPSWEELILAEHQNRVPAEEEDPSQPRFGRQQEHHFLGKRVGPSSGRDRRGSAPFSRRPSGFCPLHQSAHNARDLLRPSTLSVAPAPSSPPPSPPLCTLVPVWPSTRQPWPPPISVLEGGSLGAQGLSHGDSDGAHLP